jgi:hypothetical protein
MALLARVWQAPKLMLLATAGEPSPGNRVT